MGSEDIASLIQRIQSGDEVAKTEALLFLLNVARWNAETDEIDDEEY